MLRLWGPKLYSWADTRFRDRNRELSLLTGADELIAENQHMHLDFGDFHNKIRANGLRILDPPRQLHEYCAAACPQTGNSSQGIASTVREPLIDRDLL